MSVKVESVDDQSKVDEVVMDPISSILEPPENISGGTFVSRVYLAVGRRYIASMRRSVQGIVLYEADRCLSDKYDALKPFQRKVCPNIAYNLAKPIYTDWHVYILFSAALLSFYNRRHY